MNRSESIVKIAGALLKAQKNIGGATKGASNPFFKSRYADLGAVMEACKDHLNEQGIAVLQPVVSEEGDIFVETILLHESGEFLSGRMRVLEGKNMQDLGSGVSYARRYGLQSLVFIPSEDDDGEVAVGRGKFSAPKTEAPKAEVPKFAEQPRPKGRDLSKVGESEAPKVAAPTPNPMAELANEAPVTPAEGPKKPNFREKMKASTNTGANW